MEVAGSWLAGDVDQGPGRPPGAKDKKPRITAAAVEKTVALSRKVIKGCGELPLPYMLKVMNDRKQPPRA